MINLEEIDRDRSLQKFMSECTMKLPSEFSRGDVVLDFTGMAKKFPSFRVFLVVGMPKYYPEFTSVTVSEYVFMNHRVPHDTCYFQTVSFDSYCKYPVFSMPSQEQESQWARGED